MEITPKTLKKVIKFNKRKIRCPVCKKFSDIELAPFCSKKCSDLDLMKWLSDENYINIKTD